MHRSRLLRAAQASGLCFSVSLFILLGLSAKLVAQAPVDTLSARAIGEWRTHLPYTRASDVAACSEFVAWLTEGSVVLQFLESGEIQRLDKVNVLSQADPALIACNPFEPGQLLVGYADGGLDVLQADRVTQYTDAIAEADIFGQRGLLQIRFASPSLAIVCAEFGYLLYDPQRGVFIDDVRLGTVVNDAAVVDGDLYLATGRGVLRLRDFERQPTRRDPTRYEDVTAGFGESPQPATAIVAFNGELVVALPNTLAAFAPEGDALRVITSDSCLVPLSLEAGPTYLTAVVRGTCPGQGDYGVASQNGRDFDVIDPNCTFRMRNLVEAPDGTFPFAGRSDGVGLCRAIGVSEDCSCINLDGPRTANVFAITARDSLVAVASGGISDRNEYTFNRDGVFVLGRGGWTNYNENNNAAIAANGRNNPNDFNAVAITDEGSIYAGAYFEGLVKLSANGSDTLFDETNSSLRTHVLDSTRVRVAGLDLDEVGNLWVNNHGAARVLSVRAAGSQRWNALNVRCATGEVLDMEVDDRTGYAWMVNFERGLVAFDANGTFDDLSDDRCRLFQTADGLPPGDVTTVHIDLQGSVWVGTTNGIAKITCGRDVFEGCQASRPTSEIDGNRGFFFDGELIRCIESDGGNRKWIGTDNGLFVLDARTDEQIAFYTEANSPLINSRIRALEFDAATGLMWIGTQAGLMSIQTESTGGNEFRHGTVEVYPQPVRPDYQGPIAIRGLALDSNVKITDADGRLVYETESIGGQAVWDGRDYTGRRPTSGIYFVWASTTQQIGQGGPATVVAKIALLR